MKRVGIFLIMVALIVGVVGFGGDGDGDGDGNGNGNGNSNGNGGESCTLTIDSTTGGAVTVDNVAIPGGLILTYDAGTLVSLNATPDSGYQFVRWTGDVYTVDDVRASETIITVNGDYSIMADFEVLPPARYSLSIIGPVHGSVTTPGEGTLLIYEEGTVVNLVAKPDINASSTTITMNGDYYICAHFREIPVVC